MILRTALPHEHGTVRSMLADAALPIEDLDGSEVQFLVAANDGGPVGAVGLEAHGDVGLLRSLVVRTDLRGSGIGGQLVDALEAHARGCGVGRLVLLTQTAKPFFASRGYQVITREDAPEVIRGTAEFRSLCPASATCMTKSLD